MSKLHFLHFGVLVQEVRWFRITTGTRMRLRAGFPTSVPKIRAVFATAIPVVGFTLGGCSTDDRIFQIEYIDTTASRDRQGMQVSWKSIESNTRDFIMKRPYGSTLVIYSTGKAGGKPFPVTSFSIKSEYLDSRNQLAEEAKQKLNIHGNNLIKSTYQFRGSWIVEDIYQLGKNGLALAKNGSRPIINVHSDLQQHSSIFPPGLVIRGKSSKIASIVRTHFPSFGGQIPAYQFYSFPGGPPNQGVEQQKEQRRKAFFRQVLTNWNCSDAKFFDAY